LCAAAAGLAGFCGGGLVGRRRWVGVRCGDGLCVKVRYQEAAESSSAAAGKRCARAPAGEKATVATIASPWNRRYSKWLPLEPGPPCMRCACARV